MKRLLAEYYVKLKPLTEKFLNLSSVAYLTYEAFRYYFRSIRKKPKSVGEPCLVVMGGDSCSRGRGFEYRRGILDTLIFCKNSIACLKRPKNKKDTCVDSFLNKTDTGSWLCGDYILTIRELKRSIDR